MGQDLSFLQNHPRVYAANEEKYRLFVEAVFCIGRSGAQWRFLPRTMGT